MICLQDSCAVFEFSLLGFLCQVLGASVRFLVLLISLSSVGFFVFEFLDASFSSLGCFVFEFYVRHFRILRDFLFRV